MPIFAENSQPMISSLLSSTIFVLFVIIALGFIVGRISIKGITLDVSAVIFVALLFGHLGIVVPAELGNRERGGLFRVRGDQITDRFRGE